jgi:hypothetical protein
MNQEERKAYNKTYYSVNREIILKDLCSRVECEYCGRTVIKNNILIHERSEICKRHRQRKMEKEQFRKEITNNEN